MAISGAPCGHFPHVDSLAFFNRSYYEQVTTDRVYWEQRDQQYPPPETQEADIWHKRCEQINTFEKYLVENRTIVLKVFLNVSKEQERERLLERIQQPEQQWDFSANDLNNHRHWDEFMQAYAAVTSILVAQLKSLHTSYPPLSAELRLPSPIPLSLTSSPCR